MTTLALSALRDALAKHDSKVSECPDTKLDPKKDCPRCGANSSEGCRVTALADAMFVSAARTALGPTPATPLPRVENVR